MEAKAPKRLGDTLLVVYALPRNFSGPIWDLGATRKGNVSGLDGRKLGTDVMGTLTEEEERWLCGKPQAGRKRDWAAGLTSGSGGVPGPRSPFLDLA